MTAYEAIMIMLGTLTLMMSIISIVIKLLLYIIETVSYTHLTLPTILRV